MSDAWKAAKPFINGGVSGMMATTVIQPIDMVKVRLQLGAKGSPVRSPAPLPLPPPLSPPSPAPFLPEVRD